MIWFKKYEITVESLIVFDIFWWDRRESIYRTKRQIYLSVNLFKLKHKKFIRWEKKDMLASTPHKKWHKAHFFILRVSDEASFVFRCDVLQYAVNWEVKMDIQEVDSKRIKLIHTTCPFSTQVSTWKHSIILQYIYMFFYSKCAYQLEINSFIKYTQKKERTMFARCENRNLISFM